MPVVTHSEVDNEIALNCIKKNTTFVVFFANNISNW